jgi:phospholipid/cholesterol/gamma-HCH transport system substrate-binding protein
MRLRHHAMRATLLIALVGIASVAAIVVVQASGSTHRVHVTAYFSGTNGVFVGDDVRIRGVNVGKIESIEPEPARAKVTFWFDDRYRVPADANAVILSPTLVTARAIQLTPPYRSGDVMQDNTVIPEEHTAVPMEWDDFRDQLQKLSHTLQPTEPGGVSTLGAFVDTVADNLRGQGPAIHDAILKLSAAVSIINDHSKDSFDSVKNLATLVAALRDATSLIEHLNTNLATVTGLLAESPDAVGRAVNDLNDVVGQVTSFVKDNQDTIGVSSDKLAAVTTSLTDSLDDIKQALHVLPNTAANAVNLYQPAQGTLTGVPTINNFSDPITFLCGAIQAASRMGAEQSAKLCVQYLAPIVKNRQYNFPPLGFNPIVGAVARPNEVTYSEDWMRPDYVPPQPTVAPTALPPDDLAGLMMPPGAGS